jgi:CRISPR-associated endonuclease Csn1
MKNLLLEDIPDDFINRQLNDSRYISKFIRGLLSHIVREDDEQEAISKNIITCTGGVTDRLKKDWGMNDVWNKIILPRFERMNKITGTDAYTTQTVNGHTIPNMPLELQKGFSKKRIDHRHHAMDAIVIACADRNIVNYLNNESASKNAKISRVDLRNKLCSKKETDTKGNYTWIINKPWDTFSQDCYTILTNIIVSFKQNIRVINKTTNRYQRFDTNAKKVYAKQVNGDHWAIRTAMHKETVYGEVNLRKREAVSLKKALKSPNTIVNKDLRTKILSLIDLGYDSRKIEAYFDEEQDAWSNIDVSKIEIYYYTKESDQRYFAVRKQIDKETIKDESKIAKVTDTGIQKILLAHLETCEGDLNEAFSPEGIERMNANITTLNGGKAHKPIYRARIYENANKFSIGKRGNKGSKFVEDAEGTHLFFAIYEPKISDKKSGKDIIKRTYNTIPLSIVIERQKAGLSPAPDKDGIPPKYLISPNDLVYLPTDDDIEKGTLKLPLDRNRIYKMVSASGETCYFLNYYVANVLKKKTEFESQNKFGREPNKDGKTSKDSKMIKDFCIPIKVNRLGKIIQIGDDKL